MKISGIYQVRSKVKPNRAYIGSAINITSRWRLHLWQLKKHIHHSVKLQRHYDKYGKNDLVFSILIGCDKQDLLVTEQFFLDSNKPYFNNCLTSGSRLGTKATEETKMKMRLRKHTDKWKKAQSQRQLGHIVTEETRAKISAKNKNKPSNRHGYFHSLETRQKISKGNKGKIRSEEVKVKHSERMKSQLQTPEQKNALAQRLCNNNYLNN